MLVYLFLVNILTAQTDKVCSSKVVIVEDLNSIDKCKAINDKLDESEKPKRQVFLRLSHLNRRFLRKRKPDSKKVFKAKETVKAISELDAKGIKDNSGASATSNKIIKSKTSTSVFKLYEVDFIPVFKNCGKLVGKDVLECFKEQISIHIQNNFEYPKDALEDEITGKVTVHFLFNKNGSIKIQEVIDPNKDKILSDYTKELIKKLPSFTPATKNGIPVPLTYQLSLDFSL
ncbi:hypothetical protein BTO06_17050 [Tenacibaculum sp. SZ-18]|nr:hypothetical protein BTO06_17050 [Tenacibaculum sp. SZ-18]